MVPEGGVVSYDSDEGGQTCEESVAFDAQQNEERSRLRELMRTCPVPLHLIAGDQDPLEQQYGTTDITTIPAAGHYPHLSHPALVGAAIKTFSHQIGAAPA
jgi:pimeloyl-ACP methyl ester carboxylesterase